MPHGARRALLAPARNGGRPGRRRRPEPPYGDPIAAIDATTAIVRFFTALPPRQSR